MAASKAASADFSRRSFLLARTTHGVRRVNSALAADRLSTGH
jgi:hypothetical protein